MADTLRIILHPERAPVISETEKAVRVHLANGAMPWVPRSVMHGQDAGYLVVDSWWAEAHQEELGEAIEGRSAAGRPVVNMGEQKPRVRSIAQAIRDRQARQRAKGR